MEDFTRLIISDKRLKENDNNILNLTINEAHYLNKVMRIKTGQVIYIINGKGSLWKGTKIDNSRVQLPSYNSPYVFQKQKKIKTGLAIALPKNGFDDVIKMCTEIGVDLIQPLYSDHQIKKISNKSSKFLRWELIINESVEQSERLWKPKMLNSLSIYDWIESVVHRDIISISVTRFENCLTINEWFEKEKLITKTEQILWNVVGPEGGWSSKEVNLFKEYKIQFVKLSENILRTSTAAITATSILNQCINDRIKVGINK